MIRDVIFGTDGVRCLGQVLVSFTSGERGEGREDLPRVIWIVASVANIARYSAGEVGCPLKVGKQNGLGKITMKLQRAVES